MAFLGIKIKPLKLLGNAIQIAAPVVVGLVAGLPAGIVAVAASGGTMGVKKLGKLAEGVGLGRPHKIAAPASIMGLPTAFSSMAVAFGADNSMIQVTGLLAKLEAVGVPPWLSIGLILWVMHQAGNNVANSGNREAGK